MTGFKDYEQYDAVGLADLIRTKQISPLELCEEAIRRIEQVNPKLNAVICRMYDLARKAAAEPLPGGPLAGVPFLLKDLLDAYAGVPMTSGSKACRDFVPDQDSELVHRYKQSGLVTLGKTNTPEFGLVAYTEPELFGATRNPWNPEHTPGGSSGGSAAAVASGMVPMASGGDGGGSLRIPAACCGLFGLKPTRGRTPTGPYFGEIWQGAVVEHVITRTVRDSAVMLDAVCSPDAGAPYIIQAPARPYLEEIQRPPARLRIAFDCQSPLGTPVHSEYIQAVADTARLLERLGHYVEEARPQIDGVALAKSYICMCCVEVAAEIDLMESFLKKKVKPSDMEPMTWTVGLIGRTVSAVSFAKAKSEWGQASRIMGRFHENYDVYLTPTLAQPPVRIGELRPKPNELAALKVVNGLHLARLLTLSGLPDKLALESLAKTPFTQLANLTGQPAMSVPLHWTSDGLPCGMHFMAGFGEEATLLRLAAQLEMEKPWRSRRPPIWAV
jgi:amidase